MDNSQPRRIKPLFGPDNPSQQQAAQSPLQDNAAAQVPSTAPATSQRAPEPKGSRPQPGTAPTAPPKAQKTLVFFGLSDPGLKRSNNEDHFIAADLTRQAIAVDNNQLMPDRFHHPIGPQGSLLAVADGLGGHDDGEIASHIAVEAVVQTLFATQQDEQPIADKLLFAVQEAHNTILRYVGSVPGSRSMSSTLTAVHIGHDEMTIAQVGDSRAYIFADGQLSQLTEDQTIVHMMVKKGLLTPEEADTHPDRHVILQALGQGRAITPEVQCFPFQYGECLLLCSDGLSSYVPHELIESILRTEGRDNVRCQRLLEAAYAAGGEDNVTILLARLYTPQASSQNAG